MGLLFVSYLAGLCSKAITADTQCEGPQPWTSAHLYLFVIDIGVACLDVCTWPVRCRSTSKKKLKMFSSMCSSFLHRSTSSVIYRRNFPTRLQQWSKCAETWFAESSGTGNYDDLGAKHKNCKAMEWDTVS